jgi:arylsulfatase A-like enzyme
MMPRNVFVVAVDGLRASALGAYGNTIFETPHSDQLASQSLIAEWCFGNSTRLASVYGALWFSAHPANPPSASSESLGSYFTNHGYSTCLLTDSAEIVDLPGMDGFRECVQLSESIAQSAENSTDTGIARLFAEALERIMSLDPPYFVWLHARGMYGPWDAPLDMRRSFADEEDPEPYHGIEPPAVVPSTEGDYDADRRFQFACAYNAHMQVLDGCLGGLVEGLTGNPRRDALVVLLGVRGFPLGEHGRIGGIDDRLPAEQLHVPLLVRRPDDESTAVRTQMLVEHSDVGPTIVAWALPNAIWRGAGSGRDLWRCQDRIDHGRVCSVALSESGWQTIRTPAWCLRRLVPIDPTGSAPGATSQPTTAMFVRPDDRWELNDVAELCAAERADLEAMLDEFTLHGKEADIAPPGQLS